MSSAEDDDDTFRKKKKPRTAFSREQVSELEKKFNDKKYLSSAERGELAEKLKLSDMQVKTWFQNRRMKFKRQTEEAEMEIKSPKYPYSPFMPYSPIYSYMPYKSDCNGLSYGYSPPLRTCSHQYSTGMETFNGYSSTISSQRFSPGQKQIASYGVISPSSSPSTPLSAYSQTSYFGGDYGIMGGVPQYSEWQRTLQSHSSQ